MAPKLVQYTAESADEDVAEIFVNSIPKEVISIYKELKSKKNIQMTRKHEIAYQNAEHCHICDQKLNNDRFVITVISRENTEESRMIIVIKIIESQSFSL